MRFPRIFLSCALAAVFLAGLLPVKASAQQMVLNPSDTFYGARIDLEGELVSDSLTQAVQANINWLAIDIDWQSTWARPNAPLSNNTLDDFMQLAARKNIQVLVSITNAPEWALTQTGPDPLLTAEFVLMLTESYPAISAVELFPGANTTGQWGATPSPSAYLANLQASRTLLRQVSRPITLIAGGFMPVQDQDLDIEEAEFLQSLYDLNGQTLLGTISIQYPDIGGVPFSHPSSEQPDVLRRYESLRIVMLRNGHQNSSIWLTSFSWPENTSLSTSQQTEWLEKAYHLLYAQFYIDGSFFNSLNPSQTTNNSLVRDDGRPHPVLNLIYYLTNPIPQETASQQNTQ